MKGERMDQKRDGEKREMAKIRGQMKSDREGEISTKEMKKKGSRRKAKVSHFLCMLTLSYNCGVKAMGREKR